ncbi:hypothetical protein OOJ91_19395 [Micromonospora lupini]|uniref:hypothetical protein n=1 Tax=Micromonospora lupini TaxID=285679 RepID=UPI002257EAD1|nr:hypothetical protein [Micromonospora lupini]MCX5068011.1 hypothetical protein [Micromonospora lupini]
MDAGDDRLRSAVLAGVAVAALAVGGWWWRAAAPETAAGSAGPSTATPSAGPSVSTALERLLASEVPEDRVTVRINPESGEVVEFESRSAVDPQTGKTLGSEDAPGDLPVFRETIWREQRELPPGEGVTRQASADGAHYVLQYRCTRPGALAVTGTGAEIAGPPRIDCDGAVATAEVRPGRGPFLVSLSAVGDEPIDVEAQLVAIP